MALLLSGIYPKSSCAVYADSSRWVSAVLVTLPFELVSSLR